MKRKEIIKIHIHIHTYINTYLYKRQENNNKKKKQIQEEKRYQLGERGELRDTEEKKRKNEWKG